MTTPATKKTDGTQQGVCSVCGYATEKPLEYDSAADAEGGIMRYIVWGVGALAVLGVLALIISSLRRSRRRRRRRRRY